MSIVRRTSRGGASFWIVRVQRDGVRRSETFPIGTARRDLEAAERRLLAAIEADRPGPSALTVADLLSRYWSEHGQHVASATTERGYMRALRDGLGADTPLDQVDRDTLARLVSTWREIPNRRGRLVDFRPVSPATINKRIGALQRAWLRAEELWSWNLPRIPWRRLKLGVPEPRDRSLNHDQRQAFADALPPRSRRPWLFELFTGLRRGAVLKITRRDIDWQRGTIHSISKGRHGGKSTPVPITSAVLALLAEMGRLPDVGPIFPVTVDQLRGDLERAAKATGLPASTHQARHTFAQDLEDEGLGDVITDALHHSTPTLRRRYAKARARRTAEAIERAQTRNKSGTW